MSLSAPFQSISTQDLGALCKHHPPDGLGIFSLPGCRLRLRTNLECEHVAGSFPPMSSSPSFRVLVFSCDPSPCSGSPPVRWAFLLSDPGLTSKSTGPDNGKRPPPAHFLPMCLHQWNHCPQSLETLLFLSADF